MKIRETKVGDYNEICNLLKAEDMMFKSFDINKFKKMLVKNKGYYLVASEKGKIIGNIFACDDGGYYGYIYKLVIHPNHRNKGVASILIKKILEKFAKDKIRWIYAHIRKDNSTSISLFNKLGFKVRDTHLLLDIYKEV